MVVAGLARDAWMRIPRLIGYEHAPSRFRRGINHTTNPDPVSGVYLSPDALRHSVAEMPTTALLRTDHAFLDAVLVSVVDWREYAAAPQRATGTAQAVEPALLWWYLHFVAIRDFTTRGYPAHFATVDSLYRDPEKSVVELCAWLNCDVPSDLSLELPARTRLDDEQIVHTLDGDDIATFDTLYDVIDRALPLSTQLLQKMNETAGRLLPRIQQHRRALLYDFDESDRRRAMSINEEVPR